MAARQQAELMKRLRDAVHDALEDGTDLESVHAALSLVRAEVNDTLGWRTRVQMSPYPPEPESSRGVSGAHPGP